MKKLSIPVLMITLLSLSSCELIGNIFEAGVWAGALLVIGVIALVIFLIARLFGGK